MLKDSFSRKHNYLRISVTDKCNLRCRYCIPPTGVEILPHHEILRNEEFIHLIKIFVSMGIKKIRFTGGEPLIRKNLIHIIEQTRDLFPDIELCLTTNATFLHNYIDDLIGLNVKKLNISLDTLSKDRYEEITMSNKFDIVLENLERVIDSKFFDVKINAVLFKETLSELDHFINFYKDKNVVLRFIERMPFTREDEFHSYLSSDHLVSALSSRGELIRNSKIDTNVAQMYNFKYKDEFSLKIGIIPPITHRFCHTCNRLRLTSNGFLKTCLHSENNYDLKTPLRSGLDEGEIKKLISDAVNSKSKEHKFDCLIEENDCLSLNKSSFMSKIGG